MYGYSIIRELRSRVGKVEDIGIDAQGECFGEFMRIQVSVNIIKPLKKLIILKQEREEDIPILVAYERLPDFCFCYGCIEHQFRECRTFVFVVDALGTSLENVWIIKVSKKKDLPFRPWLKAVSLADRTKLNRAKEKWSKEQEKARDEALELEIAEIPNLGSPTLNLGHKFGSTPNHESMEAKRALI